MVAVAFAFDTKAFINQEVVREIDLTGQYATIVNKIRLESQASSSVSKYFHSVPKENFENLSNIRAYLRDDPQELLKLEVHEKNENFIIFRVVVPRGIASKSSVDLVIEETLAQKMTPLPKTIGIFDMQLILFEDNIHYPSPYNTESSITFVKFPFAEIESYTKPSDGYYDLKGKQLTYGPYSQLESFPVSKFKAHYQNPKGIPYFTKVTREIEVSHWGNIAVSEWYTLVNRGAGVKGEFSRIDVASRHRPSAVNAIRQLEAILPRTAWGLYYRDEVGNVSTSHAKQLSTYVHLEINPRFPIMGGWKDIFNIGYNLPARNFLKQKDNQFVLNITFGLPFKEIIGEDMLVKVILPEGAENIQTIIPFDVDSIEFTTYKSFLDFSGKPTLVIEKKNALDFHRKPFQVIYTLDSNTMIIKPLILSLYVFIALLLLIISFRIDFSLEKSKIKKE